MNNEKKILTLIVPTFNMEQYLDRCLSSLIVDDDVLFLLEVIVVNDGSLDRSSEIAHKYEYSYPQTFKVIDKKNGHYGSCINVGLSSATGCFVKVLDADDSFDPVVLTRFLKHLSFISKESVDMVLSDYSIVNEKTGVVTLKRLSDYSSFFSLIEVDESDRNNWFHPFITYRTNMLHETNYVQTEGIPYTDNEWCFYPLSHVNKISRFNGPLYRYSIELGNQSTSTPVHIKSIGKEVLVLKKIAESFNSLTQSCHKDNVVFMKARAYTLFTNIYQLYILTYCKYRPDLTPLIELDDIIKINCPDLYQQTSFYVTKIMGKPFHIIKDWRNKKHWRTWTQQKLYMFADFINSLRHQMNG